MFKYRHIFSPNIWNPRLIESTDVEPIGISQLFHHCDKIPVKDNLKKERFILAHGFRHFSPLGSIVSGLW
jgi:hypothetical protein